MRKIGDDAKGDGRANPIIMPTIAKSATRAKLRATHERSGVGLADGRRMRSSMGKPRDCEEKKRKEKKKKKKEQLTTSETDASIQRQMQRRFPLASGSVA